MKNYIKFCVLFSLIVIFCGCTKRNYDDTIPVGTTTRTDFFEISTATTPSTVYPEITTPDLSLDIAPGSYLLKYEDEITGDYLDYYIFIPENAEISMPLVVFLHGDGEINQPETLENYGMIGKAREIYGERYPFIALSPCTRVASWTDGTIPETLKGLIDQTAETYLVDRNRIIITGHSRGAMGVWYMISTYGDYFSAAVPISCGASVQLDFDSCATVPVLAFVGDTGEDEYKYRLAMERIIYCIQEAGGKAELIILDNAVHGQTHAAYTAETFWWMLDQKGE